VGGMIIMKEQKVITISFGMVKAFLIRGDKYILVDTGLSGKLETMKEELKKNNVNNWERLSFIYYLL
jgi:flavorubredoxin